MKNIDYNNVLNEITQNKGNWASIGNISNNESKKQLCLDRVKILFDIEGSLQEMGDFAVNASIDSEYKTLMRDWENLKQKVNVLTE